MTENDPQFVDQYDDPIDNAIHLEAEKLLATSCSPWTAENFLQAIDDGVLHGRRVSSYLDQIFEENKGDTESIDIIAGVFIVGLIVEHWKDRAVDLAADKIEAELNNQET